MDDLEKFCEVLEEENVNFIKRPKEGKMKFIAFVRDPTGYWIEIIQRRAKM